MRPAGASLGYSRLYVLGDVTVRSLRVGDATIDLRYSREGETTLVVVLKREGDIVVQVEY